jgi:hypothetical protein
MQPSSSSQRRRHFDAGDYCCVALIVGENKKSLQPVNLNTATALELQQVPASGLRPPTSS